MQMVIYLCYDGNLEWFEECCSDSGWLVVVELVITASSASFGLDNVASFNNFPRRISIAFTVVKITI